MKRQIGLVGARTVMDLGCAECKFVKELAMMDLRRIIGLDLEKENIEKGFNYLRPSFYNSYNRKKEDLHIEVS